MSSTLSGNSPSWLKDKSSANCTPVRDSSSLKGIRYGPGHEKYPSWPIPASSVAEVDPAGSASPSSSAKIDLAHGGSVRSKSWTESTDYPKEKVPSYARPYMKKMMMAAANSNSSNANSSSGYSHQLKTVLEKCEKAKQQERVQGGGRGYHVLQPPQGYRDHQHQNNSQQQQHQHPPAEKEYNIPSPPERDSGAVKPLTQEDVENYSKKYEELLSQYAGSEGYHSYISSECSSSSYVSSSSTTPFLDLLRRESGDLLNHQHHYQPFYDHLDPSDPLFALAHLAANRSGRESVTTVVTNSSGSSSGTETLKCFGSASDVSIASSSNNRWDSHKHPGKHSPSNKSPHSPTKSWSPPTSDLSSREINLKKFPLSTYTRPSTLSLEKQQQQQQQIQPEKDTPSPTSATTPPASSKCQEQQSQPSSNSPIIDTSKPPSVAERIWELEQKQSREKIASSLPPQPPPPIISMSSSSSLNSSSNSNSLSFKRVTQLGPGGLSHSSETLPLTSSLIQSIKEEAAAKAAAAAAQQQQQQSLPLISTTASTTNVSSSSAYKNLWNGGEKETPTTPPTENATTTATSSSPTTEIKNGNAGSVSGVQGASSSSSISGGGEGESISYSYLDPEKKHKVADMTLKAIQKKALLSYYERHAGKGEGATSSAAANTSHNKGAVDANQGDNKSEHGKDDGPGANERLGFMSKYNSGQLAGRDGVVNGWQSNGGSLGGAQVVGSFNNPTPNNGTTNNNAITSSSSEPPPPERPPKKPHLRQFNPHQADNNDPMNHDSSPPPPLPRAPIRPPAPNPSSSPVKANLVSGVPPVPSKPVVGVPINAGIVTMARSPSPDLPLPPPPPIAEEEEVEVLDNDEPLPPPPSLTEVSNCLGSRSRSVSGLSSYLHKDSYLAQRKERTLGYEGRYRRTLSPSGMGSNNNSHKSENGVVVGIPPQHPTAPRSMQHMATSTSTTTTSTGKLDTSLTPSGWEKYHNIRPPSTTVIFSSHELPKPVSPTSGFTRSVSCDSNLFNNKTGFTQSTIPPPIAQVAPLRDPYYHPHHYHYAQSQSSLLEFDKVVAVEPFHHESSSSSSSSASSSSSLTFLPNGSDLHLLHNGNYEQHPPPLPPSINKANTVMVSPLQYNNDHRSRNYQTPNHEKMGQTKSTNLKDKSHLKKSELSLRVNCTSDVGSQTEVKEKENLNNGSSPSPTQNLEKKTTATSPIRSGSSSSTTSSSGGSCSSSFDDSSGGSSSSSAKGSSGLSGGGSFSVIPSYTGRQKSKEELECEELSRSLIKKLPQGDKLQKILVPLPEHKTTADYMEGLFQLELKLSKPEKEEKETNTSPRSSPDLLQSLPKGDGGKNPSKTPSPTLISQQDDKNVFGNKGGSTEDGSQDSNKRCNGHAPLPADSAYFTTSECKAKFLTQYVNDMNSKSSPCKGQDSQELNQQKEMLVSRISRKLEILRTEQLEIREEIESNEDLGHQVVERVKGSAKRNEFDKFKLHVEEIEKITSLLLGLSGRLARAENALMSLTENNSNPQEKKILESKRDKLREQLEEAKGLKENIDRRSAQVSIILQKYLTAEDYADYHHFVKMKAKLIIDAREIDDKIKLGEEQMVALKDTLSSYPASS